MKLSMFRVFPLSLSLGLSSSLYKVEKNKITTNPMLLQSTKPIQKKYSENSLATDLPLCFFTLRCHWWRKKRGNIPAQITWKIIIYYITRTRTTTSTSFQAIPIQLFLRSTTWWYTTQASQQPHQKFFYSSESSNSFCIWWHCKVDSINQKASR